MNNEDFWKRVYEEAEIAAANHREPISLIDVFRSNYEGWTQRLFPAWKKVGKHSCYRELALLLNQAGFPNVSEDTVSSYMMKVRRERILQGVQV